MNILLVEDNHAIASQISTFLEAQGWRLDFAATGKLGVNLALTNNFDVIILDLNLPDIDGLEVCEQIKRQDTSNTPILMLTARDAFEDKAQGFGKGADDYLTKPFDLRELVLRCQAMKRRPMLHKDSVVQRGKLRLDKKAFKAEWDGRPIKATKTGFVILSKLLDEYPYPVSRSELLQLLWGDEPPESNSLKTHMYELRKATQQVAEQSLVLTISNIGYKLVELDD
ncbi:response regulator transcription factor [Aliikangiella coralliicola]|uniref:Response regulator transcription factor n=1 Tax=Aliikangiella coralliicola TaxID=2592383 RepID=A0A545U927_9GAMM|nr:response regulator transcription factor [Aliikangiella coralliicola]TQV85929.1 response regulator transcription factor [Aliikangiella coralliicola]